MFVRASAALLAFIGVFATKHLIEDPERIDREYFSLVREELTEGETYKVGDRVYLFQEKEEISLFNKELGLLDRVDRVLDMMGRKLELVEGGTKIVLDPFVSIRLETEDGCINVGNYYNMFETREELVQRYVDGDRCDICKGKRWSGSVIFRPDEKSIHLSGPIENSTCNYKLIAKGEELAASERIKTIYFFSPKQAPKEEVPDQTEEEINQKKSPFEEEKEIILEAVKEAAAKTVKEAIEEERMREEELLEKEQKEEEKEQPEEKEEKQKEPQ